MKKRILAVLALLLFLPALSLSEGEGTRSAELPGYGIEMEIPRDWITVDGKAAYNTESINLAAKNFQISEHMVFSDDTDQNHLHAFKVPGEMVADGEGLLAAIQTSAGESGGWFDINGLRFLVFVDVERSMCCAIALVETGMVILAAQPIESADFVAAFDRVLGSVTLSGEAQ